MDTRPGVPFGGFEPAVRRGLGRSPPLGEALAGADPGTRRAHARCELVRLERTADDEIAVGPGPVATLVHCDAGGGSGALERTGERRALTVVPGTVLVDTGRRGGLYRLPPMRARVLSIPRAGADGAGAIAALDPHCGLCDVDAGLAPLIESLWRVCRAPLRRRGADPVDVDAALERLTARVALAGERARRVAGPVRLSDPRLARAAWYVEAHLGEALDVAELAAVAGLSVYRFAHLFAAAAGESPHRYLMRRRVERSIEALDPDGPPLVEIAQRYGFASQAHFTKRFGDAFGVSPGRWRKRLRGGASRLTADAPIPPSAAAT